jgi:arginyl-tRNA synthetase
LICNYLFDLAGRFNLFYNKWPILRPESYTSDGGRLDPPAGGRSHDSSEVERTIHFRLALTAAVGQVIKNGLNLLGIETLEKM